MAKAPYTPYQQEVPDENVNASGASEGSFGGSVSLGLSGLGDSLLKAGATRAQAEFAKQTLTNELIANDANTEAMKKITEAYSGYQKLKGRAAQEALPAFQQRLQEISDESLERAPSLDVKANLSKALQYTTSTYYRYGQTHADKEFSDWQLRSAGDASTELQNQAVLAMNNPDQMHTFLNGSDQQVKQLMEDQGWDQDSINAAVKKNRSAGYSKVFNEVYKTDPLKAQAFLEEYSSDMTADDRVKALGVIRTFEQNQEAHSIATDALNNRYATGTGGTTADLLKREEGFRSDAYFDVNAYRTGYGSDTTTDADGTVRRVTSGTLTDKAGADRDLNRRIGEFAARNAIDVGDQRWNNLPDNVRAGLNSVAYNYGSLPNSVVAAAKTGDPIAIAAAVQALKSNPARRAREAAIIRGDSSIGPYIDGTADRATATRQVLNATADRPDLQSKALADLNAQFGAQEAERLDFQRKLATDKELKERQSDLIEDQIFKALDSGKAPPNILQLSNDSMMTLPAKARVRARIEGDLKDTKIEPISRETEIRLVSDIRSGKITDLDSVFEEYKLGHLTRTGLGFVQTVFKEMKDPAGNSLQKQLDTFLHSIKSQITLSNDLIGQRFPEQDAKFYEFQWILNKKIEDYRKTGKDPRDLIDPANPAYMGDPKALAPFQTDTITRMLGLLNKGKSEEENKALMERYRLYGNWPSVGGRELSTEIPGDRGVPVTNTVPKVQPPKRKPGEDPAAFIERKKPLSFNFTDMPLDQKLANLERLLG